MKRNKAYYRWQRRRAIHHKAWIVRYAWKEDSPLFWTPSRIGALSKGKIHCSCWMCRRKSYDELSSRKKLTRNFITLLIWFAMGIVSMAQKTNSYPLFFWSSKKLYTTNMIILDGGCMKERKTI